MEKVQSLVPTFKLNDGREIPVIAFGTGSKLKGTDVTEYVENALEAGFSHIDTAAFYRTEPYVADAIRNAGLSRSELFVTTKFGLGTVPAAIRRSLRNLNLKSVDLYLIHSPNLSLNLAKTWAEFETFKEEGLAKSIGVSNFTVKHLAQIVPTARIVPAINQIELHPYNLTEQAPTLAFCAAHGIVVEAYSPLSPITRYPGGPLDSVLDEIAARIGGTPAQAIFKWIIAKGAVVVTTTTQRARLDEYLSTTSLPDLTAREIAEIDAAGARGPPTVVSRAFRRISHRARDAGRKIWILIAAALFLTIFLNCAGFGWWQMLFQ